jgi:methionyl-tRNA formyltransferase
MSKNYTGVAYPNKLKSVFFGNNIDIFDALNKNSDVKAVFTKNISDYNYWITPFKKNVGERNIPIFSPNSLKNNTNIINTINSMDLDLLVCCGYHLRIPKEIISSPKIASINVHPAYLPSYRGQHVIQWALINKEPFTGVTLHHMVEKFDEGDIIDQKKIDILKDDNALTLHKKIHIEGSKILENIIFNIYSGKNLPSKKQDSSIASYFSARKPEDGEIDWKDDVTNIKNKLRALVYPWPGAYTIYDGKKIIIDSFDFKEISCPDEVVGTKYFYDGKFKIFGKNALYTMSKKDIRNTQDLFR